MKIAIIGTGYVGLISGACFSEFGMMTVCIDKDVEKIAHLCQGEMPIYEPGLSDLVINNVQAGRLSFSSSLLPAVCDTDAIFIAVGTPNHRGNGHADLSYVFNAAEEIAPYLTNYTVVITKSTVPVGTTRKIAQIIRSVNSNAKFDICSNPEFLRQGSAINDFMRPDRVIIGTDSEAATTLMRTLYRPLYLIETPIVMTTIETAELIKYASNSFLATKITFINEMADLCERLGTDVKDVARGMGLDGRIGGKFLHAGPGYGGSCFPKDTVALTRMAQDVGISMRIVETIIDINHNRKQQMVKRIIDVMGGSVEGLIIAALGVTFKPNTDDLRESTSLVLIPALQTAGATLRVYDPVGMKTAKAVLPDVIWCQSCYEAIEGADILVILTEWNEFRALDLSYLKKMLRYPIVIDLRNIYGPNEMAAVGLCYYSIGRAPIISTESPIGP